jgi:DhnA family fructose-bisphosphate aldolase class Ia
MKTAIVYYSLKGSTKKYCESLAKESGADIFEVTEKKHRGMFSAFIPGCPDAMKQKASLLAGEPIDLTSYDKIVISSPVWAGMPTPAFNSIVKMLPAGKEVEIHLVSGGGSTEAEAHAKVTALVEKSGSKVVAFKDILSPSANVPSK